MEWMIALVCWIIFTIVGVLLCHHAEKKKWVKINFNTWLLMSLTIFFPFAVYWVIIAVLYEILPMRVLQKLRIVDKDR